MAMQTTLLPRFPLRTVPAPTRSRQSPVTRSYYPTQLAFAGSGISNNSGIVQNFVAGRSSTKNSGRFTFGGSASAGENIVITNQGGNNTLGGAYGAFTSFDDSSTAAKQQL